MPEPWPLAAARAAQRRLVPDRRRGTAVLLAADTVLLSAAAAVWLPLLAPDEATAPPAPVPSTVVSPSPTIITEIEPPGEPPSLPGVRRIRPHQDGAGSPAATPPDSDPSASPVPPASPTPEPPPASPVPSAPPTERETPPSPEPSPMPAARYR